MKSFDELDLMQHLKNSDEQAFLALCMPKYSGTGWIVRTQKDRGLFYQNFTLALLESKNCVRFHWFKYQDNDPSNLKTDPSTEIQIKEL